MSGDAGAGLVVFSPLPPSRSGIAAYTAELVPALAARLPPEAGGVTVVVAREEEVVALPGAARVISERTYRRSPALAAAPHLHQLGNSLDHAHVHRAALRRPGGIVVLHEVVLHHLVEALTLGRGRPEAYEAALAREHGAAGRRLARLRRAGLFSPWQRYLMPLLGPVLEAASGVIVHSRYAASRLPDAGPPVRIIPHLLSPEVARHDGLTRQAARARLGLPEAGAPILLMLGHVTPPKQAALVLEALAALHAQAGGPSPPPCLVIGGAEEAGLDLDAALARLGLPEGAVRRTGWLAEDAFFTWLRAADLLLALRFPAAGETSGTLVRALGMGTPALAYDYGPAAEFPDAVLARLPFRREAGGGAAALAATIAGLLAEPEALAARGAAARAHVRRTAAVAACAEAYAAAIRAWHRPGGVGPASDDRAA